MEERDVELFPCELSSPATQLADFARDLIGRLVPALSGKLTFRSAVRTSAEYEFDQVDSEYGDGTRGFRVVERTEYYEGGGWTGSRDSVSLTSFGLPDGVSLSLSFGEHTLHCILRAPGPECGIAVAALRNRFDLPPPTPRLDDMVREAQRALGRGNMARAIRFADGVLRFRPKDPDALLVLGSAAGAEEDYELASVALELLVERDPGHIDGLYNLGNVYFNRFEWGPAEHCFRSALAAGGPNHAVHYQLARTLERQDRLDEAAAEYRAAIASSPNPGGIWGFSGMDFTEDARTRIAALGG